MIGYHYTTGENWKSIQEHGLLPQVPKGSPFTYASIKLPEKLIWLFDSTANTELEVRGQLMHTLANQNLFAESIVELIVIYTKKHLAPFYKELEAYEHAEIIHTGTLGFELGLGNRSVKEYHRKNCTLLTKKVAPENVYLNREWSTFELRK